MSFELDTCSLRDVIVIVCVRETLSLPSITENKCSIIAPTRKRGKTLALVLKQIRLLFVSLWEKREERREKCEARTYNNCERFMLIVLFAPSPLLTASCSACCRSSKSFTLLNDDYYPHSIHNEIRWELLSSSIFFGEQGKGEKKTEINNRIRQFTKQKKNKLLKEWYKHIHIYIDMSTKEIVVLFQEHYQARQLKEKNIYDQNIVKYKDIHKHKM